MVEQYLHMVCVGSPILSSSTIFPIGVAGKRVSLTWRRSLVQIQHRKPFLLKIPFTWGLTCCIIVYAIYDGIAL